MISTFVLIGLFGFLYCENNFIVVTRIAVESERLPDAFDGYRIVHLSDLHNKEFGRDQQHLVAIIEGQKPDLIAITGDIIDSRRYNTEPVLELVRRCTQIAPTYFVTGNHEWRLKKLEVLKELLEENGVHILQDAYAAITKGENEIYVVGIDDPASENPAYYAGASTAERKIIKALEGIEKTGAFKILLAHRPEMFSLYSSYQFDVILSGHAHGGQVRLPFIGGLVAPGQGLFPKYTAGKYEKGDSVMIVSRGLGNSIFPQRLFNRPEVVVITLKKA